MFSTERYTPITAPGASGQAATDVALVGGAGTLSGETESLMGKLIRWLISHAIAIAVGFGLGVYFLPILTAAPAPDSAKLEEMAASALYTAELTRDLRGSDFVHWGEGTVSVSATEVSRQERLAPGPGYKFYRTQGLVVHEDSFVRSLAVQMGDETSFSCFGVDVPSGVDFEDYDSILVWCEAFGEFITAASYK